MASQTAERAAVEMQAVARALRELARIPSKASPAAAKLLQRLISDQFRRGVDPYGKAWKPLKASTIRRKGHARPNVDTHDLWDSLQVKPLPGAGVSVTFGPDYAVYVQRVRPILPKGPVPKAWGAAITQAVNESAQKSLEAAGGTGKVAP